MRPRTVAVLLGAVLLLGAGVVVVQALGPPSAASRAATGRAGAGLAGAPRPRVDARVTGGMLPGHLAAMTRP